MAEYKSNPVTVRKSADQIFDTLTDLQGLAEKITGIPADSVPEDLGVNNAAVGDDAAEVTVKADIQVPALLKPMLNGPMQKMVDEVAQNLRNLNA